MVTVVQQSSLDGGYYSVPHREWKMLGMRDITSNATIQKIKQNGRRETALAHGGAALSAVYILRDACS